MTDVTTGQPALLARAEYERRKEHYARPRRSDPLGPAVPLGASAVAVLIEVGATSGDWMPDAVRLSLLLGPLAALLAAVAWIRFAAPRAVVAAGLVCARCARPLLLSAEEEDALLETGLCPRCGLRTLSDAHAPGAERRLPPMTALGEH